MTSLMASKTAAPVGQAAPPKKKTLARRLLPYGYLSPTAILIVVLMVVPIVMVIIVADSENSV